MIKSFSSQYNRWNYRITRKMDQLIGTVRGNGVKAFWWNNQVNFGDLLTPALLKQYDFTPIHSSTATAQVISVGSVLQLVPERFSGYIVGSGIIEDKARGFPNAKILAVRGVLTRERINAPADTPLGDPGLLASSLIQKRAEKKYVLGVIPHFNDLADERLALLLRRYPRDVVNINVERGPAAVIQEIDQCEYIFSSSLHGVVVADSLGIPNAWMHLSDRVRGKGFKFYDYASAYDCRYEPVTIQGDEPLADLIAMTHPVPANVARVKQDLDGVFRKLREILRAR